jgi:hypothetical protein
LLDLAVANAVVARAVEIGIALEVDFQGAARLKDK